MREYVQLSVCVCASVCESVRVCASLCESVRVCVLLKCMFVNLGASACCTIEIECV